MKRYFIDTNVIVYANDSRHPEKQDKAIHLIRELMAGGNGVISSQVLQEYANVALTRLKQQQDIVLRQLTLLESFETVLLAPALVRRAVEIRAVYKIAFWDSCIISAAEYAKCDTIYSEDLNAEQYYSGIKMRNPFH